MLTMSRPLGRSFGRALVIPPMLSRSFSGGAGACLHVARVHDTRHLIPGQHVAAFRLDHRRGASTSTSKGSEAASSTPAGRSQAQRPVLPPEAEGIAAGVTAAQVDAYLESKLSHPEYAADPSLARGLARAEEAGMPSIAVSAMQGQFLSILVRGMKVEKVLEIGTLGGYSTSFLSKSLPSHGRIDTIEYSPLHASIAQQNFIDTDLYPFPTVHVGPAIKVLRDPSGPFASPPGTEEGLPERERGYDLCFIDANKEDYHEYWLECLRLTRKGGVIVLDNAIQDGRIVNEENVEGRASVTGLRKVYDWVEKDQGKTVLMSALQTVGAKYWDGFAIAIKL